MTASQGQTIVSVGFEVEGNCNQIGVVERCLCQSEDCLEKGKPEVGLMQGGSQLWSHPCKSWTSGGEESSLQAFLKAAIAAQALYGSA